MITRNMKWTILLLAAVLLLLPPVFFWGGMVGLDTGELKDTSFRASTATEQYAAIISGFWIKPAYMLLSVILALFLFRRQDADLTALKWALLMFFFGEAFCALNYLTAADKSYLLEYLHSFGMTAAVSLAIYGLFDGMDHRIIRLSHPEERCAALALCPRCIKHADVPCGLRRFFYVIILALIILALLPLMVPPYPIAYNTNIFGVAYYWSHPVIHQLYEIRFCPLAGGVLMAGALLVLLLKKSDPVGWSKILFAAGMGPLFFGYFRLMLFAPFRENLVWFSFWEEITELLAVAAVGFILWIFRHRLFYRVNKEG